MANAWISTLKSPGTTRQHDCVALVLQGGGALGAYQAGVYEELSANAYQPDWIAGVSIGAINAALIAGNPPERRVDRLSEFWHLVSSGMGTPVAMVSASPWLKAASEIPHTRSIFNQFSALCSTVLGIPGFYQPHIPANWLQPPGTGGALSIYDTAPLRATLERLIDFDLINSGARQDSCRLGHATFASIFSSWTAMLTMLSRSGFRVTASIGDQLRVWRDQRDGLRARACV